MFKQLLHCGCGSKVNKPPREFAAYKETRLDINRGVDPDIISSVVAMPMVPDASYDSLFCSHTIEHLYAHEVAMALLEFHRVLKPEGTVWIQVPDLQSIGGKIALDMADSAVYMSANGPITPLDMLYGQRSMIGQGNFYMAHKTGFTSSVLERALYTAGFGQIKITRAPEFELRGIASKGVANAISQRSTAPVSVDEASGDSAEVGTRVSRSRQASEARQEVQTAAH